MHTNHFLRMAFYVWLLIFMATAPDILSFFHPEEDILFHSKNGKIYSINQGDGVDFPHVRRYQMIWQR